MRESLAKVGKRSQKDSHSGQPSLASCLIVNIRVIDQEIADMETQIGMKKDPRDNMYAALNTDSVKVRDGVEGHEDFGTDHPIVEAMGFVRESTRKSGLTRKKASSPASKSWTTDQVKARIADIPVRQRAKHALPSREYCQEFSRLRAQADRMSAIQAGLVTLRGSRVNAAATPARLKALR
jgi:hypothetical protein